MVGIENRYSRLRWDRSGGYGRGNQARDPGQFARLFSELPKFCVDLNCVFEILPLLCGERTILRKAPQDRLRHYMTRRQAH
jgi:hypothetical protein